MDISILLVEDSEFFSGHVSDALEERGIRVRRVEDGDSAREQLEAGADVDCVVTNYQIPGLSGIELTEAVVETWGMPVVILTGAEMPSVVTDVFERGTVEVASKQRDTDDFRILANRIRTVVRAAECG